MNSQNIPFTLTNVAETAVAPINADNTLSTTNSNNTMTFGGLVISPKGKPFEVLHADKAWRETFGTPFHSSEGVMSEPLRHLADAVNGGDGYVVRVVPKTATFPVIHVAKPSADVKGVKVAHNTESIDTLNLSSTVKSKLTENDVNTIGDLTTKTEAELLAMNGIGDASVSSIKNALAEKGLHLSSDVATRSVIPTSTQPTIEITAIDMFNSQIYIGGTSTNIEENQSVTVEVLSSGISIINATATISSTGEWVTYPYHFADYDNTPLVVNVSADNVAGDTATAHLGFELDNGKVVINENTTSNTSDDNAVIPEITISNISDDNVVSAGEYDSVVVSGTSTAVNENSIVVLKIFDESNAEQAMTVANVGVDGSWVSDSVDMTSFSPGNYRVTANAQAVSEEAELSFVVEPMQNAAAIIKEALLYGESVTLTDDDYLALYIVDGADSENRYVSLMPADPLMYGENMFELNLVEVDSIGYETTLETLYVSLVFGATDDMGSDVYIETVLENQSDILRAECAADVTGFEGFTKEYFTGASNGSLSDITEEDYQKALSILSASIIPYTAVLGLGCYDESIIRGLITTANNRRIGMYFDVNPRLNYDAAATWKEGLAMSEPRAICSHFPYTCKDPYHKNRNIWGLSGVVFTAKAAGVAKTISPGGWHYTPAGQDRAIITRDQVKPIDNLDEPDFNRMYRCRINKLNVNRAGQLYIDDSLTCYPRENYLRFEQQVSVADAISRDVYALCQRLKHEPDGTTEEGLTEGVDEICEGYVDSGALVTPRYPDEDGEEEYIVQITQKEVDFWEIKIAMCVTGSFRRAWIEPILVR